MNGSEQAQPNMYLRDQRRAQLLTQKQVAESLGVTDQTVGRWERGEAQPSAYYVKKLCELFDATPEALGMSVPSCPPPELGAAYVQGEGSSVEMIPLEAPRSDNRLGWRWLRNRRVGLIAAALLVLVLGGMSVALGWNSGKHPSHTQAFSPTMAASHGVLYQAVWSKDLGGWKASNHWHWSAQDGGSVMTDSGTNSMMSAPFVLNTPHYAIQTDIAWAGYSDPDGHAFGIIFDKTPQGGYVCGAGAHVLPQHDLVAVVVPSDKLTGPVAIQTDLARVPRQLDTDWHIYRVEVNGSRLRYFVDGKLVAEVDDITYVAGGRVGIYVSGAFIRVKHFTVFAL